LVLDCAKRRVLGEDVELVVEPYDETNTVLPIKKIIQSIQQGGNGLIGLVGVQTNQFPHAMDLAEHFLKADIPVVIGGFHVSGCLAMLPSPPSDDPSEQAIGCTLHVVHRARILRLAMLSLYVSASLLAASGLIAALTVGVLGAVHWASWVLLVGGVSCVLIAAMALTREAAVSLSIVEAHASEIESRSD
jgi:hypothetical protein